MQKQETPKKKAPTSEEALAELEQIVTQMENGQISLEETQKLLLRSPPVAPLVLLLPNL